MDKIGINRIIQVFFLIFIFSPILITINFKTEKPISSNIIDLDDDSPSIDISSIPSSNFEELYNEWYNSKIEMIFIAPNDTNFIDELIPLMEWKNQKGVKTIILSNFSEYTGSDNAEKIRNMIKEYHENENIQWVLLAGDVEEDLIPIRYSYNPDTIVISEYSDIPISEYSNWNEYLKPTDFYYSALSGTWDDDGDGKWGENPENNENGIDEIIWSPDVYVGRLPASNANELQIMVNKTLKYESNPENGTWMNQMLLAGGVSSYFVDNVDPDKVIPDEDEARLTEYIWQNYVLNHMNFTHLTKTTTNFTASHPPEPNILDALNSISFINGVNEGFSTILIAGHSDPTIITDDSKVTYYSNSYALSSSNINKPSLIYADACTTSSYDKDDYSIGERLIKRLNAGAIGYIGGLRVTWYLDYDYELEKLNRGNAKLFWKQFFEEMDFQQGKALYNSKVAYLNSDYFQRGDTSISFEYQRKNILTYNLLGDPEVDIYTDIPVSVPVPNYFVSPISPIHEGQLVSFPVIDMKGHLTPNARVHLTTLDGKYFTAYANKEGIVKFRLPAQSNENYSVTITGHNLIPSYLNFTTIEDSHLPELRNIECMPNTPTISDRIQFNFEGYDNQSGVESITVLLSQTNFNNFESFQVSNGVLDNTQNFTLTLNKLDPGEYVYAVVIRDYSNKTRLYYDSAFSFSIATPLTYYVLIFTLILVVGLAGLLSLSSFTSLKKNRFKE